MTITLEDVKRTANLSRIAIDDQTAAHLTKDLDNIMQLMSEMNTIDTTDIVPMSHPLNIDQPLREDKITEPDQRDTLQQNATQTESGLYIVPAVIEGIEEA